MTVKNGWNWIFGHYQWMSFSASSGDVTYVKSSTSPGMGINIDQTEGSDSVSDDNGNLLFYTNGVTVWNSSGNIITTALNGSNNSMQSSTIIRSPYSASSYYVFTTGNWTDPAQTIDYSIIDFGLDPTGTTVSLNTSLSGGSNYDENLTSTRHSNGTDFWIVARRRNSTYFDAWSSVTLGMSTNIVSSDVGHEFNGINRYGQIKMSPSGDRIGFAIGGAVGSGFNPVIAVYDFDTSTGIVSNPTVLVGSGTTYNFTFTGAVTQNLSALNTISCDFSPDGKFLYASLGDSTYNNNRNIVQFNLDNLGTYPSASGNTVIPDTNARIILDPSDTQFGGTGGIWNGGWMYGIHRGPNQRLYFLRSKSLFFLVKPIGVYEIKYPNNLVSSPTSIGVNEIYYGDLGPDLALPNISGLSLPPQPQCSTTTYCINYTDSYLDDTYTETGTTFDNYQVWVGDTNGLFIYYSTGNTQWCLSNTLGGDCILFGKSPCVSLCPDLCEHYLFEGICPTPTPTPTINCDVLDFQAIFDCDVSPTPSITPTLTPTPSITPTVTPTDECGYFMVEATITGYTPTPTATPTMTPTPEATIVRPFNFSGDVTFNTLDSKIQCASSSKFQDCFNGTIYYTTDSIDLIPISSLEQFMIFKALVNGETKCVAYLGIDTQNIGNDSVQLLEGPIGYSNLGDCVLCIQQITQTPTQTPTVTPTPSVTPTLTPTMTPTNSANIPCNCWRINDVGGGTSVKYTNCGTKELKEILIPLPSNNTGTVYLCSAGDVTKVTTPSSGFISQFSTNCDDCCRCYGMSGKTGTGTLYEYYDCDGVYQTLFSSSNDVNYRCSSVVPVSISPGQDGRLYHPSGSFPNCSEGCNT